ncbi:MAG TPA: tripartite tricarboxylate transporter TctB family protein [Usitatibacter sp.]|nr:tripartite tricarboxylate transporter TctB family protein [Usitatibacter sp.]
MKPFLRSGDFWSGLALAALGAYILVTARRWDYMTEEGPGPGFFPIGYGGLMLALSILLVLGAVLKPSQRAQVQWKDVSRAMTAWAAFVACVAIMPLAGFAIAFALLAVFIVKVMCGERLRTALIVGIAGSAAFYALFELALDLSLPRGMLF